MKKKLLVPLLCLCLVLMTACEKNNTISDNTSNAQDSSQIEETLRSRDTEESKDNTIQSEAQTSNEARSESTSEDTKIKDVDENEELVDGMRPEFKEAMDSYEAFYDEYCEIIKKYTENPSDMELLADYTDMLTKAVEVSKKFEAWENSDLNSAELKYYLDVNNRVTQKLLEVAE